MPLNPAFTADPYAILSPDVRWYPGDEALGDMLRGQLIPPLVDKVRRGVADWPLRKFSEAEQREIVFRDIHTDEISHTTRLDAGTVADWRNVVGWLAKSIKDD